MRDDHGVGRALICSSLLLGLLAGGAPACVESKCFGDSDCAGGTVCQPLTGECTAPECTSHSECSKGQICEGHTCVVGCTTQQDCTDGLRCVSNRCRAMDEQCQCPLVPDLCLEDVNPASATWGKELCIPGQAPAGTMLFFGSVLCPHCTGIFSVLLAIEAELVADDLQPRLVFAQLKTVQPTPANVSSNLPGVTSPVVQDVDGVDMWEAYQEDWYHAVVLDTHSCITARFGPLSSGTMGGEVGQEIEAAWRRSLTPACPEPR